MYLLLLLVILPACLTILDFFIYIFTGRRSYHKIVTTIIDLVTLVGLPMLYFLAFDQFTNDCCSESATFSPEHSLTIYSLIFICVITYFISRYKKGIISPIIETLINTILLGAIIFNIFIAIQVEQPIWLIGNLPIVILYVFELIRNHKNISNYSSSLEYNSLNKVEKLSWELLNSKLILKIPILLILCLPVLSLISSFLLLFGQKPDSIIKAFTDTYKHGFSQLDHLCDNVACGGHFLCSVAAKGHKNLVMPVRLGERRGNKIICNRQLLISNAFEELIEEKFPKLHRFTRRKYNKVGDLIHRFYVVFNRKIVADSVYILMKPLEWVFLITLYTFDQKPEDRIYKQYLSPADRKKIKELLADQSKQEVLNSVKN